jgi:hypothetical protein
VQSVFEAPAAISRGILPIGSGFIIASGNTPLPGLGPPVPSFRSVISRVGYPILTFSSAITVLGDLVPVHARLQ